jgi:hypothetical protein
VKNKLAPDVEFCFLGLQGSEESPVCIQPTRFLSFTMESQKASARLLNFYHQLFPHLVSRVQGGDIQLQHTSACSTSSEFFSAGQLLLSLSLSLLSLLLSDLSFLALLLFLFFI